jgi:pimeloyl-ACP methyl ester carboxylesterase
MIEIVFLPGIDGAAQIREPFLEALREFHPTRGVSYPNRAMGSLDDYWRFAANEVSPGTRCILVAESFSGLVAARWAARDPQVEAIVLCGSFARNPVHWAASIGASLPGVVKMATSVFAPIVFAMGGSAGRGWERDLSRALHALDSGVISERLQLVANEDVTEELRALRIPVVLVQFDDDLMVGSHARRELEEVCPNAQVVRFPGPHFAIEAAPLECARAIGTHIRSFGRG